MQVWPQSGSHFLKMGKNPGLFQIRFRYILAQCAKMYRNLIWKSPRFFPFWANLTRFGAKLATLVRCPLKCCLGINQYMTVLVDVLTISGCLLCNLKISLAVLLVYQRYWWNPLTHKLCTVQCSILPILSNVKITRIFQVDYIPATLFYWCTCTYYYALLLSLLF